VIRPAREADAEAVAALINAINALGPGATERMTPAVVRRDLVRARPEAILSVAEEARCVAGFATAGLICDAERRAVAMMRLDLCVEPAFRRRGHARAVMADLATEALRQDARGEGMSTGALIEGAALARLAEGAR
jgi:GNAT superfamily N-acetyltransferase